MVISLKRWISGIMNYTCKFLTQFAYIGFVTATLIILGNVMPEWESQKLGMLILIQFISVLLFSYIKAYLYNIPFYFDVILTRIFWIINVVLAIFGCVLVSIPASLLTLAPSLIFSTIYFVIWDHLPYLEYSNANIFIKKHSRVIACILYVIPIIILIISLCFSSLNIFIKIATILIYLILMYPTALSANEGFDISFIFR